MRAVGLIEVPEHPTEGKIRVVRSPVKFGGAPFRVRCHAPTLGQDSVEVLAEFGFTQEEIERTLGSGCTGAARQDPEP